jgi:hypothetical protein
MAAFALLHQLTGQLLYEVGSATEAEISEANRNLQRNGCPWRFAPAACLGHATALDSTRVDLMQRAS